jgi:Ni/Co efflux regulator RcnB
MKKIVLAVIAMSMLVTNIAFASTKTTHTKNTKNSTVSSVTQNNIYHLNTQDAQ